MFKRFINYYKDHKLIFALDMLASFAVSLIGLIYPILTRKMLNDLIPNRLYNLIITLETTYANAVQTIIVADETSKYNTSLLTAINLSLNK